MAPDKETLVISLDDALKSPALKDQKELYPWRKEYEKLNYDTDNIPATEIKEGKQGPRTLSHVLLPGLEKTNDKATSQKKFLAICARLVRAHFNPDLVKTGYTVRLENNVLYIERPKALRAKKLGLKLKKTATLDQGYEELQPAREKLLEKGQHDWKDLADAISKGISYDAIVAMYGKGYGNIKLNRAKRGEIWKEMGETEKFTGKGGQNKKILQYLKGKLEEIKAGQPAAAPAPEPEIPAPAEEPEAAAAAPAAEPDKQPQKNLEDLRAHLEAQRDYWTKEMGKKEPYTGADEQRAEVEEHFARATQLKAAPEPEPEIPAPAEEPAAVVPAPEPIPAPAEEPATPAPALEPETPPPAPEPETPAAPEPAPEPEPEPQPQAEPEAPLTIESAHAAIKRAREAQFTPPAAADKLSDAYTAYLVKQYEKAGGKLKTIYDVLSPEDQKNIEEDPQWKAVLFVRNGIRYNVEPIGDGNSVRIKMENNGRFTTQTISIDDLPGEIEKFAKANQGTETPRRPEVYPTAEEVFDDNLINPNRTEEGLLRNVFHKIELSDEQQIITDSTGKQYKLDLRNGVKDNYENEPSTVTRQVTCYPVDDFGNFDKQGHLEIQFRRSDRSVIGINYSNTTGDRSTPSTTVELPKDHPLLKLDLVR